MYSPYLTNSAGRFYWNTVKRWPAIHAACCLAGVAVGVGCLFSFGAPEPNDRRDLVLRAFGVLMLAVCGWGVVALAARWVRRTWGDHCVMRIAELDAHTAKYRERLKQDEVPAYKVLARSPQVLLWLSIVAVLSAACLPAAVRLQLGSPFKALGIFGLFFGPAMFGLSILELSRYGRPWRVLLAVAVSFAATAIGWGATILFALGEFT